MKLRISPRADADLDTIWSHIAQDSAAAANRVDEALHSAMLILAEYPGIGHTRPDVPRGYRLWRVYSYLIVYRIEADSVIVVRVIHGSREMRHLLGRD